MKTKAVHAVLVTLGVLAISATPLVTPPFDYRVSLYRNPTKIIESNGDWTEQAVMYIGNNGPNAGQEFNVFFKVTNSAGTEVCNMFRLQDSAIPPLKSWGKYEFRLRHPKTVIVNGRPDPVSLNVRYTLTASMVPERYASDQNHANDSDKQVFTFTGGGTPSCKEDPRPQFH